MSDAGITGPIIGPILPSGVSSTSTIPGGTEGDKYHPSGKMWDVAIAGFPFMLAATNEHPYARQTAQFQKEQLDTSRETGDQSLTGWWQRSQLSFHHGDGIDFYELTGETSSVEYRYHVGENIDVWTPGVVNLALDTSATDDTEFVQVVRWPNDDHKYVGITSAGDVVRDDGVTFATSDSTAPTSIAGGPDAVYVVNGANLERLWPNGTAFSAIYTRATIVFRDVFWAKERLFAVDESGYWFALSPVPDSAPVSVTSPDAFWASNHTTKQGEWHMSDSPGPAYIARGETVYAVTPDTSGDVPTLTAPPAVASMPRSEKITSLAYNLGYLCLVSDKSIRLAVVQSSNVVTGPALHGLSGGASVQVGVHGSRFYVAATDAEYGTALYEVDVEGQVSELLPARVRRFPLTGSVCGCVELAEAMLVYDTSGTRSEPYSGSQYVSEGYLETGFHRLGTLEKKRYASITPRVEGGGKLKVSVVLHDGTQFDLSTLDVATYTTAEVPISLPPTEALAFKFTLYSDASGAKAPRLLGYTLKALPVPKRQRMIQVPVHLYDSEQVGSVIEDGGEGWAFKRLSVLESAERSSAFVTYQDFTCGEQRTVYIEQIQFQRETPSSRQSGEFGGVAVVTMRAVD